MSSMGPGCKLMLGAGLRRFGLLSTKRTCFQKCLKEMLTVVA